MSKPYKSYYEKLKDPRWQKRRLEVMSAANFTCIRCRNDETTLNVHHRIYRKGADPWEYADSDLECLCESCHTQAEYKRSILNEAIANTEVEPFLLNISLELLGGGPFSGALSNLRTILDGYENHRMSDGPCVFRSHKHRVLREINHNLLLADELSASIKAILNTQKERWINARMLGDKSYENTND